MDTPRSLLCVVAALAVAGCGGGGSPSEPPPPPPSSSGCTMQERTVPNEGWIHVAEGTTVNYQSNPPASGPHYPVWARYESFSSPLARPYWVHNLEHGAIVLLHRPDAPAGVQQALRDAYGRLPNDPACGHRRALLTPDPLLGQAVAVVSADHVLLGECVDEAAIRQFTQAHRGHAPEDVCSGGTRP